MIETQTQDDLFEKYSLTPFGCAKCDTLCCRVTPIMPQLTEFHGPALLCECSHCGDLIGIIPITMGAYEMLIRSELHAIEEEKKTTRKARRQQRKRKDA